MTSSVTWRGSPISLPVPSTGAIHATLSTVKARCLPSGDHNGPSSPRVAIERNGIGSAYRSSPLLRLTVRIWLVPSRYRFENGLTAANAITLPSGDQVGRPGMNSSGVTCWTLPVATSSVHTAPS